MENKVLFKGNPFFVTKGVEAIRFPFNKENVFKKRPQKA